MAFNGSGVFSLIYNWENDAANGIKILASRMDTQETDIATNGLSFCITKDGQQTTTMPIPFAQGISVTNGTKSDTIWQTARNAYTKFTSSTPTGTSSGTAVMMGLGSIWTLTPSFSGRVRVFVTGFMVNPAAGVSSVDISQGSGAAPSNGDAVSGAAGVGVNSQLSASGGESAFALYVELTGLTLSTAYWFDLNFSSSSGTANLRIASVVIEEF